MAIKIYKDGAHARTSRDGTAAAVLGNVTRLKAKKAQATADDAKEQAETTAQHFWNENGTGTEAGAHVTQVPRKQWSDPDDTAHYHKGANLLIQSNVIKFRNALTILNEISDDGMKIYEGSDAENPVAQFLGSKAIVGKETGYNTQVDAGGLKLCYNGSVIGRFEVNDVNGGLLIRDAASKTEIWLDPSGNKILLSAGGGYGELKVGTDVQVSELKAGNIQSGSASFGSTASGSIGTKSISFNFEDYSSVPVVMVSFTEDSTNANFGGCSLSVTSVSRTGATVKLYNNSGTSKSPAFDWLAISM